MTDPAPGREPLSEALERLIQAAYPQYIPGDLLDEQEAVPRLFAAALRQRVAGDAGMEALIRSWLWDGIVTMLEDGGYELAIGGPEHLQSYGIFVYGSAPASESSPGTENVVRFPTTTGSRAAGGGA